MAEVEQQKRINLAEEIISQSYTAQKRGQWLGFVIIIVAIGLIAFSLYHDQGWPAVGLSGILSLLVYTLRKK